MLKCPIQQLLTGTKHYQNDIIRYLPESQLNCDSGGMPPMAIGAQAAPSHGYRQTSVLGSMRTSPGTYESIVYILVSYYYYYYYMYYIYITKILHTTSKGNQRHKARG
jgi:hypothetical protein